MRTETTNAESLVRQLRDRIDQLPAGQQYWLGICGPPGSGKSTLAGRLQQSLGSITVVIPMDGYHLYRVQLRALPNPSEAQARRGAPLTFAAARFVTDLQQARQTGVGSFPAFDHGAGDPAEDAVMLIPDHRLVLVEGNYLLLNDEPWNQLRKTVLDETWLLDVPLSICADRVQQRHLQTGKSPEEAARRVRENDLPNGRLVMTQSKSGCDRIIRPID